MQILIDVVVNIMDVFMVYCVICGLTYMKVKLSFKRIICGIFLGTTTGIFLNYVDASKYKFFVYIIMYLMILAITKEKLYDAIILQIISIFLIFTVQIPITYLTKPLVIHDSISSLVPQILCVIIIYNLSDMHLNKITIVIERNLLLKLFIFLSIIIYIIATHKDFTKIQLDYIFYYCILMISIWGITKITKNIYLYTRKYPKIQHDMRNMINSLRISANHSNSIDDIRVHINDICCMLDFEGTTKSKNYDGNPEDIIINFINEKEISTKNISINTDITYSEDNQKIPLSSITLMLGILLDNAVEASPCNKNIDVRLHCGEYYVYISVTNETYPDDFDTFISNFETGKSSKSNERGYGLNNLKQLVKKYKGKVSAEVASPSITIIIDIQN